MYNNYYHNYYHGFPKISIWKGDVPGEFDWLQTRYRAKEKQEEAQELKDLLDELKEKMGDIQESQGERPSDSETD